MDTEVIAIEKTCGMCRGTGVTYCCGNRDAEMTCKACGGNGRTTRFVPKVSACCNSAVLGPDDLIRKCNRNAGHVGFCNPDGEAVS